jgi:hypothetical protein
MGRVDGRKVVTVACVATVSVVGFAQLYLPFWADRDRLRGLSEESSSMEAQKEFESQMLKEYQSLNGNTPGNTGSPGSMWKNMKK